MLTPKQEQFALNIFNGMNQADAYRASYNAKNMSDNAIYREASLLMSTPKIAQRIQELRDNTAKSSIMTAQERLELLSRIAKGEEPEKIVQFIEGERCEFEVPASLKTRREAIDVMNKMTGEYVQKVQANVTYEDNLRKLIGEDEY